MSCNSLTHLIHSIESKLYTDSLHIHHFTARKNVVTNGQCNAPCKWEHSYLKLHCAFLPGTQSSLVEPGERKIQKKQWLEKSKQRI